MMMMIMMTPISIYEVRSLKRKTKKETQTSCTSRLDGGVAILSDQLERKSSDLSVSVSSHICLGSYKGVIFEIFSMQALCAVCIMCCQCLLSLSLTLSIFLYFYLYSSGQIITPHSAISSERHDLPRSLGLDFK